MKKLIISGLIISIILVLFSPFASSFPDGLEKVSEIFHFSEKGQSLINSPISDYSFPFVKNNFLSTIIAGLIGVIMIFILLLIFGNLFKRSKI